MSEPRVTVHRGSTGLIGDPNVTVIEAYGGDRMTLEFQAGDGDRWVHAVVRGARGGARGIVRLRRTDVAALAAELVKLGRDCDHPDCDPAGCRYRLSEGGRARLRRE